MIKAKIILDSNMNGERIITLLTSSPKFLDAEIEKHRNIESNSSSSRALSFPATRKQDELFIAPWVQAPTKQMHGIDEVSLTVYEKYQKTLRIMFDTNIELLSAYQKDIHKQHLNRHIESFMMQTKVMTGNLFAWKNFIALRTEKYADTNIQVLANCITHAIDSSTPVERIAHLPFVTRDDVETNMVTSDLACISAGRIAKASYDNIGKEDTVKSLLRASTLMESGHKTPFCHQIFADADALQVGVSHADTNHYYSGAIRNAVQFRKILWRTLDEQGLSDNWQQVVNQVQSK